MSPGPSGGFETNSAQIYFTGTSDNINFCGNVYEPETIYNAALGRRYFLTLKTTPPLFAPPSTAVP